MMSVEEQRAYWREQKRNEYAHRKDAILARNKLWCLSNPEKKRSSDKRIAERNKIRRSQQAKQWWAKNGHKSEVKQRQSAQGKADYRKNRARVLARHKAWRESNKGYWRSIAQRKRALKLNSAVNLAGIREWMKQVKSQPTAICYYCRERVSTDKIHFDHVVPLFRGGPHCLENLCVACQPCNQSKHKHNIRGWVRIGQQLLEL